MTPILVTSTGESTGKTAVALALAGLAAERGVDVGYMKPKGTRLQSATGKTLDTDPMLARELLGLDELIHELEPVVYSPTFIEKAIDGEEDPDALAAHVRETFEGIAAAHDRVVVEGGGRYTTGGVIDLTDADVAELFDAAAVLVVGYGEPGDLDEVLAAADAFGDRLRGVVFNAVAATDFDRVETGVVPFLESRGVSVLGVLPRERDLAGVTVADLAGELNAEVLTDAPTDALIERFVVGAMGGDSALRYFRRTKDAAVITGGDRADVQTAAIDAPGVKCLVLTGGLGPSGAVLGRAEEAGVPVLSVQQDTLATVERAEGVVRSGRTRDEETVARMHQLLAEHADVEAILSGQ